MRKIPENWRPYYETVCPMKPADTTICRWFHLEVDSHCNLRCGLCFAGNTANYENTHGRMSVELVERIYDKIKTENPHATIRCYGNSEPFLYPWLPEIIAGANRRGLIFELSSNLNYVQRLEETMAAKPLFLLVGFSGWTQETYSRSHCGGDIEKVKANMIQVAGLRSKHPIRVIANYHLYNDNRGEEMEQARIFCTNLGFEWQPSPARAISIENSLAYLRSQEKSDSGSVPTMEKCAKGFDWNEILAAPTQKYEEQIPRLIFSPKRGREFYNMWPIPEECPIKDIGCYIRWDGKVTLCPIESDRRLDIGNYLDMTQKQMSDARKGHPLCKECLRYRFNLYTNLVSYDKWNL